MHNGLARFHFDKITVIFFSVIVLYFTFFVVRNFLICCR